MKRLIATTAGLVLASSALAAGSLPVGEALEYEDNYGSVLITQPAAGVATAQPQFGGETGMRAEQGTQGMAESLHGDAIRDSDNYGSILHDLAKSGEVMATPPRFGRGSGSGPVEVRSRGDDAWGNVLFDLPRDTRLIQY